jgi:hypothetical protein
MFSPYNIMSNIYPSPYKIDSDSFNNAVKQYLKIKKNYEINKILISNDMHRRLAYVKYMRTHPNRLRAGITLLNVNGNNVVLPFDGLDNLKVLNPLPTGTVEFKTAYNTITGKFGMLPVVTQNISVKEALEKLANHLNTNLNTTGVKAITLKLFQYLAKDKSGQLTVSDFKEPTSPADINKMGKADGSVSATGNAATDAAANIVALVDKPNFDLLTHFIKLQEKHNDKSSSTDVDSAIKAVMKL